MADRHGIDMESIYRAREDMRSAVCYYPGGRIGMSTLSSTVDPEKELVSQHMFRTSLQEFYDV
jgi:hypothetical protein